MCICSDSTKQQQHWIRLKIYKQASTTAQTAIDSAILGKKWQAILVRVVVVLIENLDKPDESWPNLPIIAVHFLLDGSTSSKKSRYYLVGKYRLL